MDSDIPSPDRRIPFERVGGRGVPTEQGGFAMQPKRLPFWLCFLVMVFTACVSLKGQVPYDAVDYGDLRRKDLIAKLNDLQRRLDRTADSRRKCSQAYNELQQRLQELQAENRRNSLRIKALESELAEINFAFEILSNEQKPGG